MLNTKSFLTVDFGAGNLKLSEFEINEAGGLRLKDFCLKPLGLEGAQEATREAAILKALQEALAERGSKARDVNVCATGFHVFSKFVKLPPVDAGKVTQIIQYEAQQNVPFPLSEVVWDYQIMGTAPSGELEVLLVAVKSDVVEGLFRVAEKAKLRLNLCDASPAALCNAFRYNYGDIEECTMLLDIGAKTSNLLFFEKGKVFSRSINLGANAITQDFANEAKLKFEVAEQIKIAEGFVSLGGAYEEPENANQAAISKIARQFMTKLHIQVNQTMQFYRGQQGGSAPQRVFLAGGASVMPYTAQFFNEKLGVQPEYFNPLRNVQIDPSVNLEELARVAHSLGEVVGLGLRNLANCPVEMNLMPDSILRWRAFNEKKPYFLATVFSLVLVAFSIGFLFQKLASAKQEQIDNLGPKVQEATDKAQRMQQAWNRLQRAEADAGKITRWMEERYYWGETLADMRQVLIRAEDAVAKNLSQHHPGTEAGIWIDQMMATPALNINNPNNPNPQPVPGEADNGMPPGAPPGVPGTPAPGAPPPPISTLTLVCRAVDLSLISGDSAANNEIAFAVESQFKNDPRFDPKATSLAGNVTPDASNNTFTFGLTVTLAHPLDVFNPQQ
jgi:type IV pilus assembly protein PilM